MALIDMVLGSSHGTAEIGAVFIGFLSICYLTVALYRLTLHPLAKYPGPLLRRISGWPNFNDAVSNDRHIHQWQLHEIYGPVVRITPNMLSINTAEGLKAIYASGRANVIKGNWYEMIRALESHWSTHSVRDPRIHALKRKRLAHAFSDNAVKGAEHHILQNLRTGLDVLGEPKDDNAKNSKESWSKPRNMAAWATRFSFDVLGDLCFGQTFNCMTKEENRWIPEFIGDSGSFVYIAGYAPFEKFIRPIMRAGILDKIGGEMAVKNKKFTDWAQSNMEQRVKNDNSSKNASRRDFVHYLLRGRDPEFGDTGITMDELKGESVLLTVAGSDTSATTLSAVFFYLVRNNAALGRLTDEIRSAFTDIEEIKSGSKLGNLPYLRACIDEALRMSPPVSGSLPRTVLAGGLYIEGVGDLPEGVEVGTSAYAIHHSETYYTDPFTYRPERWIVDEKTGVSADDVALAHSAFCPFSLGTRGCIGKGLAYVELSVCIARMLFTYDIRLAPGDETGAGRPELKWGRRRRNEMQLKDMFVAERDGPLVEFRDRKVAAAA